MKIAWFRPDCRQPLHPLDAVTQLIDALAERHTIDIVDERGAHDFVSRHFLAPFDLCIYELDDTRGSRFIWPYLLRFPGLTLLMSTTLAASRLATLVAEHPEDFKREKAFDAAGSWPLLRVPILASRLVAVPHASVADFLSHEYQGANVRSIMLGLDALAIAERAPQQPITFGCVFPTDHYRALIDRAAQRARDGGATFNLLFGDAAPRVIEESDVVFSLQWPLNGGLLPAAVAAMAAGRVPVVLETPETADWPALDPQTWKPRDLVSGEDPICISVDVRDDEHSLLLLMRRLPTDHVSRTRLGHAARQWWKEHLTIPDSSARFETLLEEARRLTPPAQPLDWPSHLTDDGGTNVRQILNEFGATAEGF